MTVEEYRNSIEGIIHQTGDIELLKNVWWFLVGAAEKQNQRGEKTRAGASQ